MSEQVELFIVGHGMQKNGVFDPGAVGQIKKGEHKYIKEDLVPAIKKYLPKGSKVVFFDKHKVSNYGDIVKLAKQYNAKEVTELHYDSSSNPNAQGGHVIIYSGYSPDKKDLAYRDAIGELVGARKSYNHKGHVGISGRNNLFNVNAMAKAGITYRLLELGFGSSKRDADIMVGQVDKYGEAIASAITGGIVDTPPVSKPDPKPPVTETPKPPTVSKPTPKSVDDLAKEVIAGKWGTGDARKKNLGSRYDEVQRRVNEILNNKPPKQGYKTTSQLAAEVIRGVHGSGRDRMRSLGSRYEEVQREVNRILR